MYCLFTVHIMFDDNMHQSSIFFIGSVDMSNIAKEYRDKHIKLWNYVLKQVESKSPKSISEMKSDYIHSNDNRIIVANCYACEYTFMVKGSFNCSSCPIVYECNRYFHKLLRMYEYDPTIYYDECVHACKMIRDAWPDPSEGKGDENADE